MERRAPRRPPLRPGIAAPAILAPILSWALLLPAHDAALSGQERPRAREAGVVVGVFPTGEHNAITDVDGVRVGHATVVEGDSIRTGVTAIVPAGGDLYRRPVAGWIHVGNGYGKLIGETQVREFGEIETPILLTCTLCVWAAAEGLADWLLQRPGEEEHTINPVVGETNDSRVNDMWADPIRAEHVARALESASGGPVAEGSVGAGTGTSNFGWKGGIGTSSRVLPPNLGGWTIGVLVQTNYGGILTINGAPVGRELGRYAYRDELEASGDGEPASGPSPGGGADPDPTGGPPPGDGGSVMVVLATDAPLTARNLERLAERAMMGLARTGSYAANSSGDYVIAFSTSEEVRHPRGDPRAVASAEILNPQMSPLFAAVAEATEEAVYNALFRATTVSGRGRTLEALPLEPTLEILRAYGALSHGVLRPHGGGP